MSDWRRKTAVNPGPSRPHSRAGWIEATKEFGVRFVAPSGVRHQTLA